MRLKSKYRQEYRDGGRVDELPIEQPIEPLAETAPEAPVDNQPQLEPQPEPLNAAQRAADQALSELPPQPQQDDATLALKRQIENLRQSEQVRQQPAAMPQQEPMTREQRLAAWQAQGLSDAEVQFFQNHPLMIDYHQITGLAVHRANEAGLERGTDAHFAAVEKIFNTNLNRLQAEAAQPAMQPTPQFFAPPPARTARNPSSLVSAPVSRDIPNSNGKRPTPGKITLTPQEVEAARVSGISIETYAKNKIEYQRQRETGEYRDGRDPR